MRRPALVLLLVAALAGCGGKSSPTTAGTLLIAVNAPFSREPALGDTIARGAELAAHETNANGGVLVGNKRYALRVRRYDDALSAAHAVRNVQRAVGDGAIAIVDEGTGVDASWRVAGDADIPICITFQGGTGLVDPERRRNVFRIAPTDHGVAFRLAEYLVPKGLKVALLHDDTDYGREGAAALDEAFAQNPEAVAARVAVPSAVSDVAPEVLRARRAGATALLVWARAATIAKVIFAARTAGWEVPVYTPSAGADPVVRQALADHPDWVDGLTFASGRMTAEKGSGPFNSFAREYEFSYGAERVGVRTASGKKVIQPPEYAMYSYDFVRVLVAALQAAPDPHDRKAILRALEQVSTEGANGDARGFNEKNHEGVVDDDVYFAWFHDMTFRPVRDDPLSRTLPTISQTR